MTKNAGKDKQTLVCSRSFVFGNAVESHQVDLGEDPTLDKNVNLLINTIINIELVINTFIPVVNDMGKLNSTLSL